MDQNIYQESDAHANPIEKLIHHSSDEELSTSEEGTQDIDIAKFKDNLEEKLEASQKDTKAKQSDLNSGEEPRKAAHDSDYDTEQKSIDDTSMSTSDLESSDQGFDKGIEEMIDWDEISTTYIVLTNQTRSLMMTTSRRVSSSLKTQTKCMARTVWANL